MIFGPSRQLFKYGMKINLFQLDRPSQSTLCQLCFMSKICPCMVRYQNSVFWRPCCVRVLVGHAIIRDLSDPLSSNIILACSSSMFHKASSSWFPRFYKCLSFSNKVRSGFSKHNSLIIGGFGTVSECWLWWISCFKQVSSLCKLIIIPYWHQ